MPKIKQIPVPQKDDTASQSAMSLERQRLRMLNGRASTILTDAGGLNSPAPVAHQQLLGS